MRFMKTAVGHPEVAFVAAVVLAHSGFVSQCVLADESNSSSSKGGVLNGGVQDNQKMESSLKLLVAPPATSTPAPVKLNVQQFSGGTQYSPGQPAPALPPPPRPRTLQGGVGMGNFFRPPAFIPPPRFVPPPVPRWNYTATPANGIMTYAPGYSVTKIAQPKILMQHTNLSLAFPNTQAAVQQTNLQYSQTKSNVVQWSAPPVELKAIQLTLPRKLEKPLPPPINWEAWYQRIAHAIYAQWKENAVGPGRTTLLLTVYDTHNVDCKVIDFTPADGAERNITAETAFRESAVRAVRNLDGQQIWQFPVAAINPKKIVFDMQFDHAVGATPGCQVIHTHSNPAMRALQR
jgi:hypothetical protein